MSRTYDLAIIGAGPAGMSAASRATELGLHCVVIDEQASPGGQIYRSTERSVVDDKSILGPDYYAGELIAQRFRASGADYLSKTSVWHLDETGELGVSKDGQSESIKANNTLIATGAMERPCPIPGWTLPGVMTAGAAQIMLKSSAAIPSGPIVIAGSGPLLFLVATQLLRAGARIAAILDTTPKAQFWKASASLPKALGAPAYLLKGLAMLHSIKRAKIPYYKGVSELIANGDKKVESISFSANGIRDCIQCETLLLHQGVIPNVQISRLLDLAHRWDQKQLCWRPTLDVWGRASNPIFYIAGDGGGIGGAKVAAVQGELSALDIAYSQSKISTAERDELAKPLLKTIASDLRIRDFLDVLYQPSAEMRTPTDETVVCRCEEVSAGKIRQMVKLGCLGPSQTKAFARCGMGPCQGRMCGSVVAEIIATERGVAVEDVGYYRVRPPLKPMTIGELANFKDTSE